MINKEYCKCPMCGSECEIDTSMILPSDPPKYKAFCKNCNKVIYTFCSDAYGKISINQENNTIKPPTERESDMFKTIMWKIAMSQSPFVKLEDKYRFTLEEDMLVEKALMKYLFNSDGYVECDISKFFEEESKK